MIKSMKLVKSVNCLTIGGKINCTDDLDNLSKIVDFVKKTYPATYCYLLGSDVCYGGNDVNEIVMVDAEVLKEF